MNNSSRDLGDIYRILEALDSKQDRQTEALSDIRVTVARQEVSFNSHVEHETMIQEHVRDHIKSVDEKLADYNHQLAIHIEGVRQARLANDILQQHLNDQLNEVSTRFKKIEEPLLFKNELLSRVKGLAKLIGAIATIGGGGLWLLHTLAKLVKLY